MTRLHLNVDAFSVPLFYSLFEKGVILSASTGCSLRDFLCGQLGLSDDYLNHRVQTLFLDARPVDDVNKAVVRNGSTLALSAAMPGLLGATMRKGGRYAAFRKGISQHGEECGICESTGRVTVKLFNMVAKEVGTRLLEAGVEVDGKDLRRIVDRFPAEMNRGIRNGRMDDHAITPDTAFFSTLTEKRVLLTVSTAG
jgi:hypothetical protein